jgi:hypothetical protein
MTIPFNIGYMAADLIKLDTRKTAVRVLMLFALMLSLVWSWFVVRWYVGDTMAEYLNPEEHSLEMARRAVSLAPGDPLTHWRLGEFTQKQLPPEHLAQAISEYETAVSLAPNDYRLWLSLGTALEERGDSEKAEQALRRSVELAPSYSYPAWYLGNLLLRRGRYEEAFAELRRASENNPELRPQLFNLAWEVFGTDFESLKTVIGPAASARAHFSQYLLERNRFDEGLRLWQSLNETEKRTNREAFKAIMNRLLAAKRFHDAMAVWNDSTDPRTYRAEVEKVLDGGFEDNFPHGPDAVFGWQVKPDQQVQIGIDPRSGNTGRRSLRLSFQVPSRLDVINVAQLVAVQPATDYDFECFVRTEDLASGANPIIQIVDAVSGAVVASTGEAPAGDLPWQRLHTMFKTGDKTQAVIVRVARASCDDKDVCPIFGSVWYDDFNITRRN